ncbi:MAG: hypothetical protein ACI8RN_000979 [Glaciecola sp.]|jgi:uncharacterized protein (DUF427 family)|uniref:DUF427 domain-containing protein n=1 Tax=Congregibacter sp. TaxID=2744308 RepID=UPI0039E561EC
MWKHTGKKRPDFAVAPGPEQESVWDYPRPPILVPTDELVVVTHAGASVASTRSALRVLETASPPSYYIPEGDIDWSQLRKIPNHSFCEWKGQASYFALADDPQGQAVAWLYANPSLSFAPIDRHTSFYPARLECLVNGERVQPQAGEFYGGWITNRLVGPFKGEPGTGHW